MREGVTYLRLVSLARPGWWRIIVKRPRMLSAQFVASYKPCKPNHKLGSAIDKKTAKTSGIVKSFRKKVIIVQSPWNVMGGSTLRLLSCMSNLRAIWRHDYVIKWKHFPRYWPFVRGIHRSPVNSPHKGQWRGALMFSLICVWINGWVNNGEAGDLRRYHAYCDATVMDSTANIVPSRFRKLQNPVSCERPLYSIRHIEAETKKNAISQTTFSNAYSLMKMFKFRLKVHWSLFPRIKLKIFQHWFR